MHLRQLAVATSALVLLTACMGHSKTITTSNGSETVTTNGTGNDQTVTVKTSEGSGTFGANAVDPKTLGLPIYPGSQQSQKAGYSTTTKEGTGSAVLMTSTDSFDKVYAWYQSQMPSGSEQMHMTSQDSSTAMFSEGKEGDKAQKMVQITSDNKGTTSIMLTSATKN